ncbi:hypothetical protein OSB04_028577 [Centaurea solstitialis]|uniref:Disease resistance protein At4g27190-like leucine-rich repeats domain-containing protein n=1 Tax=Centaurea solstitialis TaxID=347529 RepID=A0AA38SUB4_9ASTR|nr:hypothetical protein OSB04_028577 [Centaurea solstitialis]
MRILANTNSCATISDKTPWSIHNMIEMVLDCYLDVENIVPSNMLVRLQKLEKLYITCCPVEKVFEVEALEGTNSNELQYVVVEIPNLREVELRYLQDLKYIWKNNPWTVLEFPNFTKLSINDCLSMEHVFTSSMVGSLLQLQELDISKCRRMEVIVKEAKVVVEEEGEGECDDDKVDEIIMLPQLKSLKLKHLPSLKGFYLGNEAFSCSSLDTLEIISCPTMSVFTKGDLATPELRLIDTSLGRFELVREEDLNSFITTKTSTCM